MIIAVKSQHLALVVTAVVCLISITLIMLAFSCKNSLISLSTLDVLIPLKNFTCVIIVFVYAILFVRLFLLFLKCYSRIVVSLNLYIAIGAIDYFGWDVVIPFVTKLRSGKVKLFSANSYIIPKF